MICICGTTFNPPARKRGETKRHCSASCKTRAWRSANPERAAAVYTAQDERRRLRNAANPEISKAREAARYAADPDGQRARVAAYRSVPENRARLNVKSVAWRKANTSVYHASVRRWEAAHPDLKAQFQATRRARRVGNGGSHTLTEWREKCDLFGYLCSYCGEAKPLTRDHKVPLSRGGTDFIANILPACRLCNSKKRTRTTLEFLAMPVNDATTGLNPSRVVR